MITDSWLSDRIEELEKALRSQEEKFLALKKQEKQEVAEVENPTTHRRCE